MGVPFFEELKVELKKLIENRGEYFAINPSVYFFILYNPVFGLKIENSIINSNPLIEKINKDLLTDFYDLENEIHLTYQTRILNSKLSNFLKIFFNNQRIDSFGNNYFSKASNFSTVSKQKLRSIVREHLNYKSNSSLKQKIEDTDTALSYEIFENNESYDEKDVLFYYNKELRFIFMVRAKPVYSIQKKLQENYDKMDNDLKHKYLQLSIDLIKLSKRLFEVRKIFKLNLELFERLTRNKKNKKSYFFPRFDIYGCRLIFLDENGKDNFLNTASNLKKEIGSLTVIRRLKDDHRKRLLEGRPGGIHHIFLDRGYQNYAFEFQFLDFESFILTYFGKNKDFLKDYRK